MYEYRVIAGYRNNITGREELVNRQENPFTDQKEAEAFAARFTPPKFTRAWVERRAVGKWETLR